MLLTPDWPVRGCAAVNLRAVQTCKLNFLLFQRRSLKICHKVVFRKPQVQKQIATVNAPEMQRQKKIIVLHQICQQCLRFLAQLLWQRQQRWKMYTGTVLWFSTCCHRVWKASNMQCLIWSVSSSSAFSECLFSTTSLMVLTLHLHDNVIYFSSQ